MLIIIDKRAPVEAKERLAAFGEVAELETRGVVPEPLSGHPDIFICRVGETYAVAPQLPSGILQAMRKRNAEIVEGTAIGHEYPACAAYNALATDKYLICNPPAVDPAIIDLAKGLTLIPVRQGFARCSAIQVGEGFITSDSGIFRKLCDLRVSALYVDPAGIQLPGYEYGLFGGCCGTHNRTLFILGSLDFFREGERVKSYAASQGVAIVELVSGPLFDGGGLFFI